MANYVSRWRSNWFSVRDRAAFDAWVGRYPSVTVETRDSGQVALFDAHDGDHDGVPSIWLDPETDEWVDVDFLGELSDHLAPDAVAVVMEVGAEKLRYLTGMIDAVRPDGSRLHQSLSSFPDVVEQAWGVRPEMPEY